MVPTPRLLRRIIHLGLFRRIARLGTAVWLGLLGFVAAVVFPILAVEQLPPWTYFVAAIGIIAVAVILYFAGQDEVDATTRANLNAFHERCDDLAGRIIEFDARRRESPMYGSSANYDRQTITQYHEQYGPQLRALGDRAAALGVPRRELAELYAVQDSLEEIRSMPTYLKKGLWDKSEHIIHG